MSKVESWFEIKDLCSDLSLLTGIPIDVNLDYFRIVENLLVHKFVEKINELDEVEGSDIEIVLPFVGSLIVSISDDGKSLTTNFTPEAKFIKKLKNGFIDKKSPLVSQVGKILGEELVKKFNETER